MLQITANNCRYRWNNLVLYSSHTNSKSQVHSNALVNYCINNVMDGRTGLHTVIHIILCNDVRLPVAPLKDWVSSAGF